MTFESEHDTRLDKEPAFNIRLTDDVSFIGYLSEGRYFQVFLQNKDGKRLDLSQFTPKYQFTGGGPVMSLPGKFIGFTLAGIKKDQRQILGLFHEMGHAVVLDKKGVWKWPHLLWVAHANARKEKSSPHAHRVLKEEQHAWVEAFRIARLCRDKGFDVLALFKDRADIEQWMKNEGLQSYEDVLARLERKQHGR